MSVTTCEEKGFIVEVAGVGNPETPPFFLSPSSDDAGGEWCCLPKEPVRSPRTIYAAELTEPQAREKDYKLYLKAPGLTRPLLVYPYNPENPHDPNGVLPTGYKEGDDAFQDYIFIPFRPVTAITNQWHDEAGAAAYLGYGEYGGQEKKEEDRKEDIKCHVRILRRGFLYIFRGKQLWRELIVYEDGTFTDVDLAVERPKRSPERGPRGKADKGLAREIWIPFSVGNTKKETPHTGWEAAGPFRFSIAFSEKQWTWTYIDWLESDWGNANKRLDALSPLYELYRKTTRRFGGPVCPPRFTGLMKEVKPGGKYHPVEVKRVGLLHEALGSTCRLVDSEAWKKAPGNTLTDYATRDWDLFTTLYGAELPPNYEGAGSFQATHTLPPGSVFGPGPEQGRGLFLVHDYLYSPLVHAVRTSFYADMFPGLDRWLADKPYAGVLWQILDSLRFKTAVREKLVACLDMEKLENVILPLKRKAIRLLLEQSLHDLVNCLNGNCCGDPDLPGSFKAGDCGVPTRQRYALHDLFALEDEDYVAGWAWVKTVAQALMLDPDTADAYCLPPERRYGRQGFLQVRTNSTLRAMENWDCNGLTLKDMLYPCLDEFPVEQVLKQATADDDNTVIGSCRFGYLRSLIARSGSAERREILGIIGGVGLIFYQLHFEALLAENSWSEDVPEEMQRPVNLLRLDPLLEHMVVSQAEKLDEKRYKALICGLDTDADPERYHSETVYVPREDGRGHDAYIVRPAAYGHFVASRTALGRTARQLPLLAMYERDSDLKIFAQAGVGLAADHGPPLFGLLYIPISALNLVSCRQAWGSGYAADRVGLALAAGDNFLKLATGAATAQAIYKAMRGGTALASLILDGARFGSRALRLAIKLGNLFGAIESGYSLYAAVDKGDEGAAWAFGAGAVFFTLGLALAPFTGGLTGAAAGVFAGLGGLCGVLGAFLSSSELEGELRTGRYGLKCKRRYNYKGPDDEPLRLLRYACLVTVQNVNVRDPKAPYGRLAEVMDVSPPALENKALSIAWPMFVAPCDYTQLNFPLADVEKYVFIEHTREKVLFMKTYFRQALVWHEGRIFATIQRGGVFFDSTDVLYEHE